MKSAEEQKKTPVAHKHYTSDYGRMANGSGSRNRMVIGIENPLGLMLYIIFRLIHTVRPGQRYTMWRERV